ncbi:MAG: YkgJ family cysteine cluster protein [Gammaproteobacteria bacterium]|nr:MAG: YkgJ family cysteine cluster protein [Gammaproteobacteria bacterium]
MTDIFNDAALSEYTTALKELGAQKTVQGALKKSFTRYENLIAKSTEESTIKPACKAGCAYCCHYKVEVMAHEIFLIKDHLQQNWTATQIKSLLKDAEENAKIIKTLTQEQHLVTNIKCPFLIENQCSIYSVRPFKCRNFHATDANACEKSFNDPENLDIESNFVESIAMFGNAHSQGFEAAVKNTGLDARAYDFTTALLEVFAEPNALKRFSRGKKTFIKAIEIEE